MSKKLNLTDLEKVKSKLEKWIDSEKKWIEFHNKEKQMFLIEGKNVEQFETNIKNCEDMIKRCKKRLNEVNEDILMIVQGDKLSLGDRFFNDSTHKKGKRIEDQERIESFIYQALKIGDIPKGEKYIDKTLYRKLNNYSFLLRLHAEIKDRLERSNLSEKDETILGKMKAKYSNDLLRIVDKEEKIKEENLKSVSYNENQKINGYDYDENENYYDDDMKDND